MTSSYGQKCPVARSLDVIGEKWSLLILRDLMRKGPLRFQDLETGLPGVAPNTLSARLKALEAQGVIATRLYERHPPRYEYYPDREGQGARPGAEGAPGMGRALRLTVMDSHRAGCANDQCGHRRIGLVGPHHPPRACRRAKSSGRCSASIPSDAARKGAQAAGLETSARFEDALARDDIEAVILCTPHKHHAGQIIAAAKAGKHVFCEKPLCTTAQRDGGGRQGRHRGQGAARHRS